MSRTFTLDIFFANIGRGVGTKEFQANLDGLLAAVGKGLSVGGLVEIDEADAPEERKYLIQVASGRYWFGGQNTSAPVLVDRRLPKKKAKTSFASPGLARFTPHRVVTEGRFGTPGHPWMPQGVILCTHLPINRPQTKTRRAMVRARLRARATYHASRGRLVIFVIDHNTRGERFPQMMPRSRKVLDAGIDEIHVSVPRRIRARVLGRRTFGMTIDNHDGHIVKMQFSPRR